MSGLRLVLTGILYGDDYFTLQFNRPDGTPDSFTLGLGLTRFPYRLALYGRTFHDEETSGFMDVFFGFEDEAGDQWSLTLACLVAEVDEIADELNTYLAAFKKRHFPKPDTATAP